MEDTDLVQRSERAAFTHDQLYAKHTKQTDPTWGIKTQGLKLAGARGYPECSCGSIKTLQGAQRIYCLVYTTLINTQHLYEAYEDAIGFPGKY